MISFTIEIQRPVYWTSVASCFMLLAALCCCNGVPHQTTLKLADPLRGASESSRMPDTTEQPDNAAVDLGSLLDAGDHAVVTLVSGGTRLVAHRAVLASGSLILAAMFRPGMKKATSSDVDIPDVEGPVLRQLVAFLYTGMAPQLPGMALQLLAVADKYGLGDLKYACEQQALKQLGVESAAAAAVVALRHSCHNLRETAIAFIKAHIFEVVTSQDFAETVRNHPGEVAQITRLLAEPPAEIRTTAAADNMASSTAATATTADITSTPTAATPTTTTATTDSTPISTATTPAAPTGFHYTQLPDATTISFLWSLSAEDKGQRLVQAAYEGSVQEVEALLAVGAIVEATDLYGLTALQKAAINGHVKVTRCLLQAGAEVDTRSRWQWTPLHNAAGQGHTAVVQLLLVANADPNARDENRMTPLHWAAGSGHTAVVHLLLVANADPNASCVVGWTPLHRAACWGHAEVAAVLLGAGAHKGARSNQGETALDVARRLNKQHMIQMLQ